MKTVFIIAVCLSLSGCGFFERGNAYLTGYSESCIKGVLYYQFASGVTVAYNQDGSVRTCK